MNWIEIVSILAAAMTVSFGAIGPALGEGRAVAAAWTPLPASRGRGHQFADVVRRPRDDRDHGDLLSRDRALVLFANPFIH
jgi:F-type H+-transporting ATPase subunit c